MRIIPPILLCILVGAMVGADTFLPLIRFDPSGLICAGAALAVLGIGISIAGKRHLRRADTSVNTFEDPGMLVTDGLYGFSRNPMYLGLVLAGFGAALISATLAALVLAAAYTLIVRYWYIAYEERAMHLKFGARYDAYCRRVGRWFGRRPLAA